MEIPRTFADRQSLKYKIRKFVGFNKAGDEGDIAPSFSYGGYGFDASQESIRAAHQDFIFDDLTGLTAGATSYTLDSVFYYTRINASGLEERFLLAVLTITTGVVTSVKIYARYLPRNSSDHAFSTSWTNLTGSATLTADAGKSFVNYQQDTSNLVAFTDGYSDVWVWAGALATPIAKLNASAPKARHAAWYDDRLFMGNTAANANAIWWSESMLPDGWVASTDGAGYKNVVSGRGDSLTAIHANRAGLMAYKKDSTYRLYGMVPVDYQFVSVSAECGAMNGHCVAELGNVVFQLDESGLMYFDGSNLKPYMQQEMALPTDNAYFGSDEYRELHSVFAYGDRLYVYDAYSHLRYRINPAQRVIDSVQTHAANTPTLWAPMRDMCFFAGKGTNGKDAIWQMGDGLSGRVVLY